MSESDVVVLTAEELRFFPFFPPSEGGTQPPAAVGESLKAKGLVADGPGGKLWTTVHGDKVRRGVIPSRVEG